MRECGAAGSASGQTAFAVRPTLCQSLSRHSHTSPLHPGCPSPPLLLAWMNVYFLFPWYWTSLLFDFLSVLVVRGGTVCLPRPPSWFSLFVHFYPKCNMGRTYDSLEVSFLSNKRGIPLFHTAIGNLRYDTQNLDAPTTSQIDYIRIFVGSTTSSGLF